MFARIEASTIVLALAAALAAGCGEDTPQGRDLASPEEREAAPAPGAPEAAERRETQPGGDMPEPEAEPGETGIEGE
jgi:hypothetical protein